MIVVMNFFIIKNMDIKRCFISYVTSKITMALSVPSNEQKYIIQCIKDNNVIVDSVAGSGKTTTVLHIAETYKNEQILLLTYNSQLRYDTIEKKKKLNIENIEIHTYHSFCANKYNQECKNDFQIIQIMQNKSNNNEELSWIKYDIIMLDEAQDMSPLYYELVHKIIRDNSNNELRICVLGDRNQSIYEFMNADARFIIYANKIFQTNTNEWKKGDMTTSFRITKPMAEFLNKHVLKYDRIKSIKSGKPVNYILCDAYGNEPKNIIDSILKSKSKKCKYVPNDILILAPTLKSPKTPVKLLANSLTEYNIYVPKSDEEKPDENMMNGKIVFLSYHQAKGLERKICIVFSFDDLYNKKTETCPNEMYVALTRASEHLFLIHHNKNNHFEFISETLKKNLLTKEDVSNDVYNIYKYKYLELQNKNTPIVTTMAVNKLLRHISNNCIEESMKNIQIKKIQEASDKYDLCTKIEYNGMYEHVSDIIGIAIPAYVELQTQGKMTIYNKIIKDKKFMMEQNKIKHEFYNIKNIKISKDLPIDELLYIANMYSSYVSGYYHNLRQIYDYKWLSKELADEIIDKSTKFITKNAIYECEKSDENLFENKIIINGSFDCVDGNKIYEFKCTESIQHDHILQLVIYAYINEVTNKSKTKYEYILYNFLTNEMLEIEASFENLQKIVENIVKCKLSNDKEKILDDEFINNMQQISNQYLI